jgi:hypothetical protein
MVQQNYLVEGLSGTGKSSVYEELLRRGYNAISTDRVWAHHVDPHTGLPGGPIGDDNWMWDRQIALSELERPEPDMLFVCGSSRNRDDFLHHFTKVFNLRIDDDTMRRRRRRTASSCEVADSRTQKARHWSQACLVSEGGLVSRRDAIRLTRTVSLAV